jgi:hypothetical protein
LHCRSIGGDLGALLPLALSREPLFLLVGLALPLGDTVFRRRRLVSNSSAGRSVGTASSRGVR